MLFGAGSGDVDLLDLSDRSAKRQQEQDRRRNNPPHLEQESPLGGSAPGAEGIVAGLALARQYQWSPCPGKPPT